MCDDLDTKVGHRAVHEQEPLWPAKGSNGGSSGRTTISHVSLELMWVQMPLRLTTSCSDRMMMWPCERPTLIPHTTQRGIPRNTSLPFIPALNAVVVDKFDSARLPQPYPEGGPKGWRGSWNVGRGTMMAKCRGEVERVIM